MWDTSRFFAAFKYHGMLIDAVYAKTGAVSVLQVSIDFKKPSVELLMNGVVSSDYIAEFDTRVLPGVKRSDLFYIDGKVYEVSKPPMLLSNGDFQRAELMCLGIPPSGFNPLVLPWDIEAVGWQRSVSKGPL